MTMLLTVMHIAYCGPAPLEFPFLLFADTSSAFLKYVFRNIIKQNCGSSGINGNLCH